jgi:hypothetical protein
VKRQLNYFLILNKQDGTFIIQESNLISLKIVKQWQKSDSDTSSSSLWVCHLPPNSLGIIYVSLHPSELVIKKKIIKKEIEENDFYSEESEKNIETKIDENSLITYKGFLEPNGENDKEIFYRCRLKLQKNKEEDNSQTSWTTVLFIFIIILVVIVILSNN